MGVCGEHQHLQLRCARVLAQVRENLPAIHSGEANVEHDDARQQLHRGVDPRRSVAPHLHVETGRAQTHLDEALDDVRILDHQDGLVLLAVRHWGWYLTRTGAPGGAIPHLWDIGATRVIIEEAGGRYECLRAREQGGVGTVRCVVFGRPAMVAEVAATLRAALEEADA